MVCHFHHKYPGGIYGAFRNKASCKAVGSSFMFIFVVCMGYNAALAVYFFISIHTKWTEREFARKVEPWLHAVPCVYAYAFAGVVVGLTTDMFASHVLLGSAIAIWLSIWR